MEGDREDAVCREKGLLNAVAVVDVDVDVEDAFFLVFHEGRRREMLMMRVEEKETKNSKKKRESFFASIRSLRSKKKKIEKGFFAPASLSLASAQRVKKNSHFHSPRVILEHFQDRQNDVVDVAKSRRLCLFSMV